MSFGGFCPSRGQIKSDNRIDRSGQKRMNGNIHVLHGSATRGSGRRLVVITSVSKHAVEETKMKFHERDVSGGMICIWFLLINRSRLFQPGSQGPRQQGRLRTFLLEAQVTILLPTSVRRECGRATLSSTSSTSLHYFNLGPPSTPYSARNLHAPLLYHTWPTPSCHMPHQLAWSPHSSSAEKATATRNLG